MIKQKFLAAAIQIEGNYAEFTFNPIESGCFMDTSGSDNSRGVVVVPGAANLALTMIFDDAPNDFLIGEIYSVTIEPLTK